MGLTRLFRARVCKTSIAGSIPAVASVVGLRHNPVIKAHYARKRAEGKTTMNALGHCMKKALALCGASGAAATTSRRNHPDD